ncbi:MAG: DUF485 domain-containing protein [Pseudomonadota bacterium]|nr:DUF485 domain-containing protein [Pseudomonadota bacterium]
MQLETVERIKSHPKYRELVARRSRFGWTLAAIMLLIYYGFIFVIAFAPEVLGQPLGEGVVTTVGIPVGILVIISAFVLTGIYVSRANSEFDRLNNEIKERVQ